MADTKLILGDCLEKMKEIPDNSIDAVITDPPYPEEFIPLYEKSAQEAKRILKNGCFFVAYSGHEHLPQVIKGISNHLDWYWLFCLKHRGNYQLIHYKKVLCSFKPIVCFSKGKPKTTEIKTDFIKGSGRAKSNHIWEQSSDELFHLLEKFTKEGDTVLDPFMGSGTTGVACAKLNRNFIGIEIDEGYFKIAERRIGEWKGQERLGEELSKQGAK